MHGVISCLSDFCFVNEDFFSVQKENPITNENVAERFYKIVSNKIFFTHHKLAVQYTHIFHYR